MRVNNEISLITIPDKDDPGCADIFVDGTVDGHSYRFILDTGSAQTHLVSDEFTLSLTSPGKQKSAGILSSSQEHLIALAAVSVGPMKQANLTAIRFGEDHPAPRNLLGMDTIGGYSCHFQFEKNTLTVEKRSRSKNDMPLDRDAAGHPAVTVRFPGVSVSAVWDSGAGITVVDSEFIANQPQYFEGAEASFGTDATGATVETPTFIMSGAVIGGFKFAPHRVAAVDLSGASGDSPSPLEIILGYTTLCQADWYFDFPAGWWNITGFR